jgi:ComF family protein
MNVSLINYNFNPLVDEFCSQLDILRPSKFRSIKWLVNQFVPATCTVCRHTLRIPDLIFCHICDRERLQAHWIVEPVELHVPDKLQFGNLDKLESIRNFKVYATWHYDPFIRTMLQTAKFTPTKKIFNFLGKQIDRMIHILHSEIITAASINPPLLVPIPPSKYHLQRRLFNQTQILAQQLSFGKIMVCLKRDPLSLPQSSLSVQNRFRNACNSLSINLKKKNDLQDQVIYLIDDIVGSGATMLQARKLLLETGAREVYGIAVAISPRY